jgi:hypothetical protein
MYPLYATDQFSSPRLYVAAMIAAYCDKLQYQAPQWTMLFPVEVRQLNPDQTPTSLNPQSAKPVLPCRFILGTATAQTTRSLRVPPNCTDRALHARLFVFGETSSSLLR